MCSVTDDYTVGSLSTKSQASNSMRDFHNVSLRVPDSIEPAALHDGSTGIQLTNVRLLPLELPADKSSQSTNNSTHIKGHNYDDVLPSETSNSVDASSSARKPDGYSEAKGHTLVLSNLDTRGQGRVGHAYHLLDGSNPGEKATFVEIGSSTRVSRDHSFRRNLGSSNILNTGSNENRQSRRTTLSGTPTTFDDPNYANTSVTVPASARMQLLNSGNANCQVSDTISNNMAAAAPPRSRSLVQNPDERNLRKPPRKPQNKPAVENESARKPAKPHTTESDSARGPSHNMSVMFDDPMYDVGLNLPNT